MFGVVQGFPRKGSLSHVPRQLKNDSQCKQSLCGGSFHMPLSLTCVSAHADAPFPTFSLRFERDPKINRPHAGFRDTSHILPRPKCQMWSRRPRPTVPDSRPGERFLHKQYTPENNRRPNRVTSVCCTSSRVEKKRETVSSKGQAGLFAVESFLRGSCCLGRCECCSWRAALTAPCCGCTLCKAGEAATCCVAALGC